MPQCGTMLHCSGAVSLGRPNVCVSIKFVLVCKATEKKDPVIKYRFIPITMREKDPAPKNIIRKVIILALDLNLSLSLSPYPHHHPPFPHKNGPMATENVYTAR